MNKGLLKRKINLQKTRNILSEICGIQVMEIKEQNLFDILDIEAYRNKALPDGKISDSSDISDIIRWMTETAPFTDGSLLYFVINNHCVHAKVTDVRQAYETIWKKEGSVMLVSEDMKYLYEFGNDSRDEANYLFDMFELR